VADPAAVAVLLDGGETLFQRCRRVDPMEVVERDAVGAQSTKALLDFGVEHLRTSVTGAANPAFRGYHHTVRIGRERRTIVSSLCPPVYV